MLLAQPKNDFLFTFLPVKLRPTTSKITVPLSIHRTGFLHNLFCLSDRSDRSMFSRRAERKEDSRRLKHARWLLSRGKTYPIPEEAVNESHKEDQFV